MRKQKKEEKKKFVSWLRLDAGSDSKAFCHCNTELVAKILKIIVNQNRKKKLKESSQ